MDIATNDADINNAGEQQTALAEVETEHRASQSNEEMNSCNDSSPEDEQDQSSFAEDEDDSEDSADEDSEQDSGDDEAGDYRHSSAKRPWENYSRKTQYTMIKKLKAEIKGLNDDTAPR